MNHETELPDKAFGKIDTQLIRDFSARTLVNIGETAIAPLLKIVGESNEEFVIQQAIDALLGIANEEGLSKDAIYRGTAVLHDALKRYKGKKDEISLWKTIRALGPFKEESSIDPLSEFLTHRQPAIRWEVVRSFGKIGDVKAPIMEAFKDPHHQVRRMAARAAGQFLDDRYIPMLLEGLNDTSCLESDSAAKDSPLFETIRALGGFKDRALENNLTSFSKHKFGSIQGIARKAIAMLNKARRLKNR